MTTTHHTPHNIHMYRQSPQVRCASGRLSYLLNAPPLSPMHRSQVKQQVVDVGFFKDIVKPYNALVAQHSAHTHLLLQLHLLCRGSGDRGGLSNTYLHCPAPCHPASPRWLMPLTLMILAAKSCPLRVRVHFFTTLKAPLQRALCMDRHDSY